jgi:CubicO group peptidase (beta-lactamase class C family)
LHQPVNDLLRSVQLVPRSEHWRDPTVEDLLTHTGGLPARLVGEDGAPRRGALPAEVVLAHAPGSPVYSNVGYGVLGALIEDVSGVVYTSWITEHVLVPLGMQSSTIDPDGDRGVPTGYEAAAGRVAEVPRAQAAHASAGELVTTIDDLLRLGEVMVAQRHPWAREALRSSVPVAGEDDFAIGWRVSRGRPRKIGHSGSLRGAGAAVVALPESGLVMAMATNCAPHPGFSTARAAISQLVLEDR